MNFLSEYRQNKSSEAGKYAGCVIAAIFIGFFPALNDGRASAEQSRPMGPPAFQPFTTAACATLFETVSYVDRDMRPSDGAAWRFSDEVRAKVASLAGLPCDPRHIHDDLAALPTFAEGPFRNGARIVYVFCRGPMNFSFGFNPGSGSITLPAVHLSKSIPQECSND